MPNVEISQEALQELLKTVVAAAIAESKKLNPLDQKKYEEALAQEERRAKMIVQMGKIEEAAQIAKKNGCSHCRWPANSGKHAGYAAPRGQGEWTTGGQAYQDGTAVMVCSRCATTWRFRPTSEYYNYIIQNGMLSDPPPPDDQCLCDGCLELPSACSCGKMRKAAAA
jgi:hypothetical protein